MNQPAEERRTRREFFRDALRYLALGGVCVLSVGLIGRSRRASQGSSCPGPSTCRECRELSRCSLPQAVVFRDEKDQDKL